MSAKVLTLSLTSKSIPSVLCDNVDWMLGEVGKVSQNSRCNAILCPPQTWNEFGKATSHLNATCLPCPGNTNLYGQVVCGDVKAGREKEILDKLFSATGGRYWNKTHDNWMKPGVPICQREGIYCGGDNAGNEGVTELRLQDFGLRGQIPTEVWELPSVRSLGFSHNSVDISFEGIETTTNLVVLKLSNCQLRSLDGLRNAPGRLSEIHLASNQLDGYIPEDIYKMGNLRKVFLNNNHFSGRISSEIGQMSSLRELWLWDNRLTGVLPSELGLLQELQQFSVNDNELSGAIPEEFEKLNHLTRIQLARQRSKSKFAGPLPTFSENEFVVEVDVSDNSFSGWLPPTFLAKTDAVETITVNLSGNRFTGPIPKDWGRFEALDVDLSGNMISDIPDSLCAKNGWNNGLVGLLDTCDAILCAPGTYHQAGRQTDPTKLCQACPGGVEAAPFFGSRACLDPALRAEREILTDFYHGSNGTSWLVQTNWLSDSPTCTWFGITCDETGFVEGVVLQNNWLMSTGSEKVSRIFSLAHLNVRGRAYCFVYNLSYSYMSLTLLILVLQIKNLDLKGNEVNLDFQQIPVTSALEFLRLSGTGINSLTGISRASNLKALHVTNNHIETIPSEVYQLSNLESLFISFNALTGTISRRIGELSNLKELYMFGNQLTGTIPTQIGNLKSLTDFVVSNNFLSGKLPTELNSMPSLEQVSVYDQQGLELITGPVPSFSQAPHLWYVSSLFGPP